MSFAGSAAALLLLLGGAAALLFRRREMTASVAVSISEAPGGMELATVPPVERPAKARPPVRTVTDVPKSRHDLAPEAVDELTLWVSQFPPLPQTASRLLSELRSPNVEQETIVRLVSQDPMLTAALLRMANSAAASPLLEVTSVDKAVMMLGFDAVHALAVRAALAGMVASFPSRGFDPGALLRHGVACGIFAGVLARRFRRAQVEEAVTVGLLHDVGKIALNIFHGAAAARILDPATSRLNESRLAKEERLMGVNHAVIGAVLAVRWELPATLVRAIELHHHPVACKLETCSRRERDLIGIVFVANQLAKYAGCPGDDPEIDLASPEMMASLGLPDDYEKILAQVMPEAGGALKAFLNESGF